MYSRIARKLLLASALLLTGFLPSGCKSNHEQSEERSIWFVHASNPHIYLHRKDDSDSAKQVQEKQQSLDEKALSDLFKQIRALPQSEASPAFLLITGDWGVDPCLILTGDAAKKDANKRTPQDCLGDNVDKTKRDAEVQNLAKLIGSSPIQDIYFVAGSSDLALESAGDDALEYFNQFFDDVQKKIAENKSNVQLHNLSRCYTAKGAPRSTCFADIDNSPYRLIGFPSQTFKNKEPGSESNLDLQVSQFEIFRSVLDQAQQAGKKILLVTHISELDDPLGLAQGRYDGRTPDRALGTESGSENPRAPWSAWNVRPKLLDDWKNIVASNSVIGIFAGHFHDSHKEIYRQPYTWSTPNDHRVALNKLFLAPPLSVESQDASPIQARGFSLVRLGTDGIHSKFYWYDSETSQFRADSHSELGGPQAGQSSRVQWRSVRPFHWLLRLDVQDGLLEQLAILLIALLTAFLTVVAIWQIPATDNPLLRKPDDDKNNPTTDTTTTDTSPFTTKIGKTVLAGLGGLVFAEVTKTLGNQQPSADTKWYYIVAFIYFFFLLLLGLNFVRAFVEALRARVAIVHYPVVRRILQDAKAGTLLRNWLGYWGVRTGQWLLSLRVPFLTFWDTFINLIQGKNQTTTRAFEDAIIEQQQNVVRVAHVLRMKLNTLLESKVLKATANATDSRSHVRVNISVLSADGSEVFYISRTPDSSPIPFGRHSVAWVSIYAGEIRWYEATYAKKPDIVLFDDQSGIIAAAKSQLKLADYYQPRHDDYEAFIVFPLPWPQRAFGTRYVKGGIHISFRTDADFRSIWTSNDVDVAASPTNSYPAQDERMLDDWCGDPEVRIALTEAVAVLGELLRGFNEVIYKSYIEPNEAK